MPEEKVARPKKTLEERIEAIDQKIAKRENEIVALKQQKENLLHPVTYKSVLEEAKRRKISPKELANLLKQFTDESATEES